MGDDRKTPMFGNLVDLATEDMGGSVVWVSDEFFAEARRMLVRAPAVFLPDEFTDRGKWMDGWESRRRREAGHDACIVRLGAPGRVRALDIDTSHFLGNHPPIASVEATRAPAEATAEDLSGVDWTVLLRQSSLRPGTSNLFTVTDPGWFSHVRLSIFPDGGVARFRVWGEVEPDWEREEADDEERGHLRPGEVDLAAVRSGGLALACSDMFFGPMNNLIAPGRAENMGGGWETRRRSGPGPDWIVLRLGARGEVGLVEVDTAHFKGNFPESFFLEGVDSSGAELTTLLDPRTPWATIVGEQRLSADARHFYRSEVEGAGPFTHVKLSIRPDGGVSRLRVWGRPVERS